MRTRIFFALVTGAAAIVAVPAQAQDTGIAAGDVLVRLRGIVVAPNEESGPILPGIPAGSVTVDDAVMPEVDFTYMATDTIGFELIASSTKHTINGAGAISGLGEVASSWVLPPTLTVQYHFAPKSRFRPYVGAGVNYTIFYSGEASPSLVGALGPTTVKMDDSFGYAVQAGVDLDITDKVFLNFDVKYIDMDTTARLNTGGTVNTIDVSIDPFVFGAGVGFRF